MSLAPPHTPVTTTLVTLNLFQGPFLVWRRRVVMRANLAAAHLAQASGRAAQWMLERSHGLPVKQVQHDEVGTGRVAA